jgi:hypothetical protein
LQAIARVQMRSAISHLPQSSSASRRTASQAGFFILSQSNERPER